ncbi:aspartic peptidase domain-containing protein [Mycotypha africana]|uniref:aspartic peptidase domain-containing protein n=1 Tax=Mycotypha africana TaxID=64632 RepID=UPI0023010123|nr:aspartic peptidase domain-containing protein [Mycotypha africana]KAI8967352.1 aspartic peptidase domain-containing protein [Mycotypha africana]
MLAAFLTQSCAVSIKETGIPAGTNSGAVPELLKVPIRRRKKPRTTTVTEINTYNSKLSRRASSFKEAPLYNAYGKEYLIEIGIGTPPQYFNITLDTGSADVWVPSISCPSSMCPYARFQNQTSSSFKLLDDTLSIEYGAGSCTGAYAMETVTLGAADSSSSRSDSDIITVPNFTVGLVSRADNMLTAPSTASSEPSNGILGLGYPDISMKNGTKPTHFVMSLYQNKVIQKPIFSIFLNKQLAYGSTGEIILGGVDESKFVGSLNYAPVISYDVSQFYVSANILGAKKKSNMTTSGLENQENYLYWAIPGQGVSTSSGYNYDTSAAAAAAKMDAYILDTGTTLTYVPAKVAEAIVMSITKNASTTKLDTLDNIYRVSCQQLAKNHDDYVSFQFSTSASAVSTTPISIQIPVSELVIPLDDDITATSGDVDDAVASAKACMFGIAPVPTGLDLTEGETWILGESVLRSVYTVFDLQQNRVGFGKLVSNVNTTNDNASSTSTTDMSTISNGRSSHGNAVPKSDTNKNSDLSSRVETSQAFVFYPTHQFLLALTAIASLLPLFTSFSWQYCLFFSS